MPKGKPHKSAPFFTAAELDLANDCARLIWHGISFESAKPCVSDEQLMSYFATPLHQHIHSNQTKITFDLNHLHHLIIAGGLKPMLRKQHELSYPQFENYLIHTAQKYISDCANPATKSDNWKASSAYVWQGGKELVDVNVQTNAGFRIPLASRILFFALPVMPIANFSNGLAKSLNLQSRPEAAIHYYYQIFNMCMVSNNRQLSKYEIPESNGLIDDMIYKEVKNSDWWQRRVLDIALLLHFNVTTVAAPFPAVP